MSKEVRILIVFDSATGNTGKMAEIVADGAKGVKGTKVITKRVESTGLEDLLEADAIIFGSPTYYGDMSASIKALFDKSFEIHEKLTGKVGAAFTSAGGTATGAETTLLSMLQCMLVHGMIVQGRADDKHYGAACVGAPDEDANKVCRALGRRTAELASRLSM